MLEIAVLSVSAQIYRTNFVQLYQDNAMRPLEFCWHWALNIQRSVVQNQSQYCFRPFSGKIREMNYAKQIATLLHIPSSQAASTIELLDDKNTVPFIARYRKEKTGGLDEEQIRKVAESLETLRTLDSRRETILASIESQGLMTDGLRRQIMAANTRTALEDLYLPFKPKRKTRASVAKEKGLQPLADQILKQGKTSVSLDKFAEAFVTDDVTSVEEALAGARDIVAEAISDHPHVRQITREKAMKWGSASTGKVKGADDPKQVYETYYEFDFSVGRIRPHQVLAINRGEKEKVLSVRVNVPERDWRGAVENVFRIDQRSAFASQLEDSIADAAQRLLLPAIERDVRRTLTEKAENHAINVFAENLRGLLNQPPLAGKAVMGIDPGFRTGCKVAVVDPTGKVLGTATIYPHPPQKRATDALKTLHTLAKRHEVDLIAIGNGTASRETEQLVATLIQRMKATKLKYLIVNEAGASVYSASPLARAELPDMDVSVRGAVSIARRVQDPLAELVKIDPKSIGVGMYQHDVDQKRLNTSLDAVVESVVNQVGVDVNTASAALLTRVAGIGPKLAENIVAYRDENGPFRSRAALKKVSGLGPKSFEQAAGFLRVRDGRNPLDASAIHPESYPIAQALLKRAGVPKGTTPVQRIPYLDALLAQQPITAIADELGTGVPTLKDILVQLVRPGRDPREDLPAPALRSDVLSMDDLVSGMILTGTVRNVVDFGSFIDIGVKQDGLLHISQLPRGTKLRVGQVLDVEILNIEPDRGRIGLGWVEDK